MPHFQKNSIKRPGIEASKKSPIVHVNQSAREADRARDRQSAADSPGATFLFTEGRMLCSTSASRQMPLSARRLAPPRSSGSLATCDECAIAFDARRPDSTHQTGISYYLRSRPRSRASLSTPSNSNRGFSGLQLQQILSQPHLVEPRDEIGFLSALRITFA